MPVDFAELKQQYADDNNRVLVALQEFCASAPILLDEIKQASDQANVTSLAVRLHHLKGAASRL